MEKISLKERVQAQLRTEVTPGKSFFEESEVYEREIMTGVKWEVTRYGHVKLDEHCPYKQGQLTTIIGHTNVGKTTLILYLLSRLLLKGKKLIVYSAENRVSQIARLLIQFAYNTNTNHNRHFEWLRKQVLFIRHAKQFTYKDLLEQVAVSDDMEFETDMIFIDPYNALKIDSKKNGHEYHYEVMEDLRIFTQTTGKSIFLNCHTVTEAQRVKPNQFGEINPPLMGDVEGGAKFPNKSDDVWVLHRNLYATEEEKKYTTHLYVGKVRNTDGGGRPTSWTEPILFDFKKDWTGFTNSYDEVARVTEQTNFYEKKRDETPF